MILKFFNTKNQITLDSKTSEIIDITKDFRTKLLDKDHMISDKFKFKDNIYFIRKDFFIRMGKIQNRQSIDALLINYNNNFIIIVGNKSTVFFNNFPVNIVEYDESVDESKGYEIANCN